MLRPGDRYTVCPVRTKDDLTRQCFKDHARMSLPARAGVHWDNLMLKGRPHLSRPIPGLGNIALSLVSAAITAIVSRRVLLVENASYLGGSLGPPLTDLLVESSGWADELERAQGLGFSVDTFATHDDYTFFDKLCSDNLRQAPTARVWRIFSNQYFLPLLLLNPHHAAEVEQMGLADRSGGERPLGLPAAASSSGIWGPSLRVLLRPSQEVHLGLDRYLAERVGGAPMVSMHVRAQLTERTSLVAAVRCARSRLAANNASTLFLATMHEGTRLALARHMRGVQVLWYGQAIGTQGATKRAADSAVADLWLMGAAREVSTA